MSSALDAKEWHLLGIKFVTEKGRGVVLEMTLPQQEELVAMIRRWTHQHHATDRVEREGYFW